MLLVSYKDKKITIDKFSGKEWKECHDVARQVVKGNVERNGRRIDARWLEDYIFVLLDRYNMAKVTNDSDWFENEDEYYKFIKKLSFLLVIESLKEAL